MVQVCGTLFATGAGFVTFESGQSAANAIEAMHHSQTMEVCYRILSHFFFTATCSLTQAVIASQSHAV